MARGRGGSLTLASPHAPQRDERAAYSAFWEDWGPYLAAIAGAGPLVVGMDANADPNASPFPVRLLQEGWHNVGQGIPDEKAPTFATSKDWGRRARCSGATRVDYVDYVG